MSSQEGVGLIVLEMLPQYSQIGLKSSSQAMQPPNSASLLTGLIPAFVQLNCQITLSWLKQELNQCWAIKS